MKYIILIIILVSIVYANICVDRTKHFENIILGNITMYHINNIHQVSISLKQSDPRIYYYYTKIMNINDNMLFEYMNSTEKIIYLNDWDHERHCVHNFNQINNKNTNNYFVQSTYPELMEQTIGIILRTNQSYEYDSKNNYIDIKHSMYFPHNPEELFDHMTFIDKIKMLYYFLIDKLYGEQVAQITISDFMHTLFYL